MKQYRRASLLPGRNAVPLTQTQISRAATMIFGLDQTVNARYEAGSFTRFVVRNDEFGEEVGEIIFSDDIYQGTNLANPNSILSLKGAAVHELAHYYRWQGGTELPYGHLTHLDEAMTSLEAALRYFPDLDRTDMQGLISDALQRLRHYVNDEPPPRAAE